MRSIDTFHCHFAERETRLIVRGSEDGGSKTELRKERKKGGRNVSEEGRKEGGEGGRG